MKVALVTGGGGVIDYRQGVEELASWARIGDMLLRGRNLVNKRWDPGAVEDAR